MEPQLTRALEPVLRDLAGAGLLAPRFGDADWMGVPDDYGSAMMWSPSGSGTGLSMSLTAPSWEQVASVADQVQEWAIENQLWGSGAATNWPPCPEHPERHPLEATVTDNAAVWVCPRSRDVFAAIGALSPDRAL